MMIGQVEGSWGGGAPRGEGDHVAASGANRIRKVAPQSSAPARVGHELTSQDPEPGAPDLEMNDLANYRVDQSSDIAASNAVAVTIDCDEAAP